VRSQAKKMHVEGKKVLRNVKSTAISSSRRVIVTRPVKSRLLTLIFFSFMSANRCYIHHILSILVYLKI